MTSFSSNTLAFVNTDKNAKIVLYDDAKTLANDLKIKFDSRASIFIMAAMAAISSILRKLRSMRRKAANLTRMMDYLNIPDTVFTRIAIMSFTFTSGMKGREEINSAGSHWDGKWKSRSWNIYSF